MNGSTSMQASEAAAIAAAVVVAVAVPVIPPSSHHSCRCWSYCFLISLQQLTSLEQIRKDILSVIGMSKCCFLPEVLRIHNIGG